jgi:hypothetical protein
MWTIKIFVGREDKIMVALNRISVLRKCVVCILFKIVITKVIRGVTVYIVWAVYIWDI